MTDIGSFDWNEAWKAVDREKRAKDVYASCADRWLDGERCRKYNRKIQEDNWRHAWERINAMKVTSPMRVLDIGAGPGTLAIPLSGIVRHVTAVEPSPGMLACLHGNMDVRGIENITTIRKKWEDIDIETDLEGPYDIVVASYSLGVPDLRDALEKMDQASSHLVYIFWFADMISHRRRDYLGIWEDLFGNTRPSRHVPNIIFNLLGEMGIYASVEISAIDHIDRFSSLDQAVSEEGEALNLTDKRQAAVLRDFLERTLQYGDGEYVRKRKTYEAKIWWETGG